MTVETFVRPRGAGLRGRLPRKPEGERYPLKWAHEYLAGPLPVPSFPIDVTEGITHFGMLGNDEWGDCVEAGELHQEMTTAAAAGTVGPDPNDTTLALSRARQFAGFGDTPPGPGTNMADYLHGLFGAGLIKAWAPVDASDRETCLGLMEAGFGLLVGVNLFPESMDQFNEGRPFDAVPGSSPDPQDGHCILWVKSASLAQGMDAFVTWGEIWPATAAWTRAVLHENPNGEAFLVVTTEEDLAKISPDLVADCRALGGGEESTQPEPQPEPVSWPEEVADTLRRVSRWWHFGLDILSGPVNPKNL